VDGRVLVLSAGGKGESCGVGEEAGEPCVCCSTAANISRGTCVVRSKEYSE